MGDWVVCVFHLKMEINIRSRLKMANEYVYVGLKMANEYVYVGLKMANEYVYVGLKMVRENLIFGFKIDEGFHQFPPKYINT